MVAGSVNDVNVTFLRFVEGWINLFIANLLRVSPQSEAAIGWFSTLAPADSSARRILRAHLALLRLEVTLSNFSTNFSTSMGGLVEV